MRDQDVTKIIYEAHQLGVWLWCEGGELKFKAPKQVDISDILGKLKENKRNIVEILQRNKVFEGVKSQTLILANNNKESVLSFAQERLRFIEQFERGTNAYHLPLLFELDENVDKKGISHALQQVVRRHEVLRSTIQQSENGEGIQVIHEGPLPIDEVLLNDEEELETTLKSDINQPFQLDKVYPIRVKFYKIPKSASNQQLTERIILLINVHHITSDGWSQNILMDELLAYYEAYISGNQSFDFPPLAIQYKDFAFWQQTYLTGLELKKQTDFWNEKLSGFETLTMPTDFSRPAQVDYSGAHERFTIDKDVSAKLQTLAKNQGTTLFSVLLSSFNILLGKYSGQKDIIVGNPTANRHYLQTAGLIGSFINVQVNRSLLSDTQSFSDLIKAVHKEQVASQLYQDLPFEKLVDELGIDRDLSRHPIFQVLFEVYSSENSAHSTKYLKPYDAPALYEVEKFDLSLVVDDSKESLEGILSYSTSLFRKETIDRLIHHYQHLLSELVGAPEKAYSQISLLDAVEFTRIVNDWNATFKEYPKAKTIHELFEDQANQTPDGIALAYEGDQLTYRQLNEKSNQLARYIRASFLKRTSRQLIPDTLIPLFLDRSLEMMIGILGVLKAGAAYVPIDVAYPQGRIDYLLRDVDATMILSRRNLVEEKGVVVSEEQIIPIDLSEPFYATEPEDNLNTKLSINNLAYVIYTSGTTGNPKGVLIEHRNVHNLIFSLKPAYDINEKSKSLLFSSYSFDTSIEVIWPTLCSGGELLLLNEETRLDKVAFEKFLIDHEITHFDATPGFLRQIEPKKYPALKRVIAGGEICDWDLANQWSGKCGFLNTYGPTENTVTSSINLLNPSDGVFGSSVPIGKLVANTEAYIFDENLQLQPIGVPGELYLGGAQLARGYFNQPALTIERFIDHPFKEGERLYKTGDWTRWLQDGNIEFLGRNDDQVKIRGYRIELGEIENQLTSHPDVQGAAVLVHEKNKDKKIVAYVVVKEGIEIKQLEDFLREQLPEYMMPSAMIQLDHIPLTVQGKWDRKALPKPEWGSESGKYVAPANETEFAICKIWEDVIGLDKVGVGDDFFRIGGSSILAMQVSHRMSQVLDSEIKVADIFKYKSIDGLLQNSLGQSQIEIPNTDQKQALLSFAQERLWFIEEFEEGTNAYHIPLVLSLEKSTDKKAIIYALQQIVSRHEVLRSTIEKGPNAEGIQVVCEDPLTIEEVDVSTQTDLDALIKTDIKRPFDLRKSYPVRVKFYNVYSKDASATYDRAILLINIHHIASDGWSIDIFQSELMTFYEAYVKGDKSFKLLPLTIQYKDYAEWQRAYFTQEKLDAQINYWKKKLSDFETLSIPTDFARPEKVDYRGARNYFTISKETSDQLRDLAKKCGTTLHSVLLSSVSILLGKHTGQSDIVIGSPIANRHFRQTAKLIGFFVNAQVNRTLLSRTQSFSSLIEEVHENQIATQFHQDLPFEKLVDELGIDRDLSRHPIFQVMFGVQSFGNVTGASQKELFKHYEGTVIGEVAKFDLSIFIDEGEEVLQGSFSYATGLFKASTIARLVEQYQYLLEQLIAIPDEPYSQISLLTPKEYQKIVVDWNATDHAFAIDKTIHELFEIQAARNPENIALIFEGEELTYMRLNEKSNQLARYIRSQYELRSGKSLQPDSLIGLCVDRGFEMVIGSLAILKAGGAYVPLDVSYPQDRIDFILEDTQAELVLTQKHLTDQMEASYLESKVLYVNSLDEEVYNNEDLTNNSPNCRATDLCYVIYTSGTSGKPKGVMVEHSSVVNFMVDNIRRFDLDEQSRCLHTTSMTFDAGTGHLFRALLAGAKLFIMNKHVDTLAVSSELEITHLSVSTAVLNATDNKEIPSLKVLTTGGEPLRVSKMRHWMDRCKLVNSYGPTEATIGTLFNEYVPGDKATNIGKAINNTRLYVLNEQEQCVPIGVIGELHIGGASLARGYLNNEELSKNHFIPNSFATIIDQQLGYDRLYKTGDLVRWTETGDLEYVGRKDSQVKIRGYRIELGEIEHALEQVQDVKQSCVLVKEQANTKYLVGYFVPEVSSHHLTEELVYSQLSEILPEYMVPTTLIKLDQFPMTANGKLDQKALPEPDLFASDDSFTEPATASERILCEVYAEVLGLPVDQIGVHQNFFKIGGNSILSIKLKSKLNELDEFREIGIADLFKYNTIHKLIRSSQKEESTIYKRQSSQVLTGHQEIAIIGMSGSFSGASDVNEFWQMIVNQVDGLKTFSTEECRTFDIDEQLLENPKFIRVSGEVEGVDLFDPQFWGLSPKEARQFDPQIRKFMEHCWRSLESSGYANQRKVHNIGVFGGTGASGYLEENIMNGELAEEVQRWEAAMSNIKDALATKTSFHLGLTGPAYSISTACSTGLVAVAEACQKLSVGTCDMALAGGSSLSLPGEIGYMYQEGMTLSSDGHCRTFDKNATGTASGSGSGVVLLKRLNDAIEDEDQILGVIKGYATNNDGDRKTFYSAPSVVGQSECIIQAQEMAGITSDEVSYVECHGTATNLGDPIEVQGLREAFDYNRSKSNTSGTSTVLGSVKANVGHTDTAAGIAGLIKVCSMMENNIIPGQVNYSEPNPELKLEISNFEVLRENRDWMPDDKKQRLAGVSSFGIGGTNAHIIVGDYYRGEAKIAQEGPIDEKTIIIEKRYAIPISAKSRQSLDQYRETLAEYLNRNRKISIEDLVYTLQERREHFNYRTAFDVQNIDELIGQLGQDRTHQQLPQDGTNKIVFMFPGQGVQYANMAKSLYSNDPSFKVEIDQTVALANQYLDVDLLEVLFSETSIPRHDIHAIKWSQVSLFVLEYALAKYLERLGVKADAYIGHSFGEYVAATLAGVFSVEDAIKIIISRGKNMQAMESGSMLAISTSDANIRQLVEDSNCEISVINSPSDIVASGYEEDIKTLEGKLESLEIPVVQVKGTVAGHSKLMDDAAIEFSKTFSDVTISKPNGIFASNLTGEIAGDEVTKANYWSGQLRNQVQFSKGLEALCKTFNNKITFIELGPGKGLSYFVNRHQHAGNNKAIKTLQLLPSAKEASNKQEVQRETILCKLWSLDLVNQINDPATFETSKLLMDLPGYQFNYQRCWSEKRPTQVDRKFNTVDDILYERSWERKSPDQSLVNEEELRNKNVLVLVNDQNPRQSGTAGLLELLKAKCDRLDHVIHLQGNSMQPEVAYDLSNSDHIKSIMSQKVRSHSLDLIIYVSPAIDLNHPTLDLLAIRNVFDWSKGSNTKVPLFASLSFDNYEVLGNEKLQEKPSIVYGATKSIPFEYFTSSTKVVHVDLPKQELNVPSLLRAVFHRSESDLIVVRGQYHWKPTYQHLTSLRNGKVSVGNVILITGGLGALGYAYAKHMIEREETCTLILIGRSTESELRKDYQVRLTELRLSKHNVIYAPLDIGETNASKKLEHILVQHGIHKIDITLHTAGVVAKSAIYEKTPNDILQVVRPKVSGIENLIKLATAIPMTRLISCSSLSSIIPSLGNMEYTAANLYLDEISARTHQNVGSMMSVNVNHVSDAGAAIDFIKESSNVNESISNAIKSHEFPLIIDKLFGINASCMSISRYDIKTLGRPAGATTLIEESSKDEEFRILDDEYSDEEFKTAQIFAQVLGLQEISLYDDFFAIGGNSILAIQVSHRMNKELGNDVKISDLFAAKTIKEVLKLIQPKVKSKNIKKVF